MATSHRLHFAASGSALVLAFAAAPSCAQVVTNAPPSAGQTGANEVSEIVVTANKREQRLTDVGLSVAVVSAEALKTRSISSVADLANVVPGLTAGNSGFSTPIYSLRGVGVNEPTVSSGSSVVVYVDEVPLTLPAMTRGATLDLERVEVLKGPQGTLYGENATGGAINYIAAKPTNTFAAGVLGSYGRFNDVALEGYVSGPLTPTLKGRIAVRGERADGWQKSLTRNDTIGKVKKLSGRATLQWEPTEAVRATLNLNGWIDRSDTLVPQLYRIVGSAPGIMPTPQVLAAPIPPADPRLTDWDQGAPFRSHDHFFQSSLRGDYVASNHLTLTSISAYSKLRLNSLNEYDGMGVSPLTGRNIIDSRYRVQGNANSFTQEFRAAAKFSIFNLIAGANYVHDNVSDDTTSALNDFSVISRLGFNGAGVTNGQRIRGYGVFTNVEAQLTPKLVLSGGIRYGEETRHFRGCTHDFGDGLAAAFYNGFLSAQRSRLGLPPLSSAQRALVGGCVSSGADLVPALATGELKEHNVPWNVNINYKPMYRTLLYARVSRGYKSGNFPSIQTNTNSSFLPVKQESVLAYELGFKTSALAWLSAEGAIFQYDYTNKQQRGRTNTGIPFGLVATQVNIPKSRIKGAELSATVAPAEGLRISASGTYLDAEVRRYIGFNIDGLLVDQAGSRLNFTAKYSGNLDVSYDAPVTNELNLFVGENVSYRSSTTAQMASSDIWRIGGYTMLDLQLGVANHEAGWRAWVWGKNVTNAYHWTNVTKTGDVAVRFPGMPATYGASFSYEFR